MRNCNLFFIPRYIEYLLRSRIRRSTQQPSSTPMYGRMLHLVTYLSHDQYGRNCNLRFFPRYIEYLLRLDLFMFTYMLILAGRIPTTGPNNAQVQTGSNAQLRARAVTISNTCYSLQCLLEAPGVALLINTSRPNWGPRP